ncbi:MAG: element excision factor XisH family protein [Chloroflexota bacterium]
MPAKDRYHNAVAHALIKSGWSITSEQVFVKFYERHLWIDIQAERIENQENILFEVKGFQNLSSPVEYLETVIGQYLLYQAVLEDLEINIPLYLAVPAAAYQGILSEEIGKVAIRKAAVKMLVFDPVSEEVLEWIP